MHVVLIMSKHIRQKDWPLIKKKGTVAPTWSVVPGRRRSISLHSTTPSLNAPCRNAPGSDTLFFGDSKTPRVISQVTVCSAGFIVTGPGLCTSSGYHWVKTITTLSATIFLGAARLNVAHLASLTRSTEEDHKRRGRPNAFHKNTQVRKPSSCSVYVFFFSTYSSIPMTSLAKTAVCSQDNLHAHSFGLTCFCIYLLFHLTKTTKIHWSTWLINPPGCL